MREAANIKQYRSSNTDQAITRPAVNDRVDWDHIKKEEIKMTTGSNMNRRSFLTRTAVVGGIAGAAPMFLPHNAFGANDRIVIGSIGVGKMGSGQLKKLHKRSGVAIGAVADVYLPRAQKMAEMVNAEAYQDYRKLLERNDIDGVVIATPLHWHALNCIHAAQAGKHIYCQKPMTHSI
ncbi:MAG: Gfo/Idh/MocA family oxidoreductase, partial [Planctomycetota bacterium]